MAKHELKIGISIIIPYRNDFSSLRLLLLELTDNIYDFCEIIIVDSSDEVKFSSKKLAEEFHSLDIKVIEEKNCFPGNARNIGVRHASSEIICFLDAKTLPSKDWLHNGLTFLNDKEIDLVLGCFKSVEISWFGKIVKASTFGNISHFCLPGSIIKKSKFFESGGFNPSVRAGEDLDWFNRISQLDYNAYRPKKAIIEYSGLPQSLTAVVEKWFLYSMENAKVNILATQKSIYFFFMLLFFLYIAYRWNYIFTGGDWNESPFFIPHLNTVLWISLASAYMALRCLILPISKKESLSFLLPFNFIIVGFIGLVIDLSKIPGRIYGFWKIITFRKRI